MAKLIMSDPSGREQEHQIESEPKVFGRGEDSDVVLGSRSVTRHHMKIWEEDGAVLIEDLSEGRGLKLEGEEVSGTFELQPGEELEAGVFIFRVPSTHVDTSVDGEVFEEAPIPTLVGTKGPTKGLEIELQEGDNDVGRDPALYLVIDEPSISRLHARITVEQGQFSLVDMRSSNGTFVNKKKVDTATIASGDIVRFGNIEFRFVYGKGSSKGAAAAKKKKMILIGVGGLIGLLLIIGIIAKVGGSGGNTSKRTHKKISKEIPLELRVEQHLKAARGSMEEYKWKQARKEVDAALDLHPISTEARQLKSKVLSEMGFKSIYDEGVSLYDLSKWLEALALFKQIPEDSFYYKKVKYKISEIEKKRSEYHFVEGKSYFTAQQYRKAQKHFISYMGINPCDRQVYDQWIKKAEAKMRRFEMRHKPFVYNCTEKSKEGNSLVIKEEIDPLEVLKIEFPNDKIYNAMRLYYKGKAELSIQELRRLKVLSKDKKVVAQAKELEQHMMIVNGKYNEGTTLLLRGELVEAKDKFHIVLKTDEKFVPKGLRSFYRENIGKRMADKLYKEGLEEFGRRHWVKCFEFWKECIDVQPNDASCMQGMNKLEETAQGALEYARKLESRRNIKKAKGMWQLVMQITRPESLPYKRANLKLREHEK
jgi:pSer/pThr/pTyr-binding forkhead associated (FHA) protein/tetratricopeptide (TPR) repeat protein